MSFQKCVRWPPCFSPTPSHHLCLDKPCCSLKFLILHPIWHPKWSQYNILSIGKESNLFINFHILLDKHWHFRLAVRVTAGKYPPGKEETNSAGLTFPSWRSSITTTSAVVLYLAKWKNISEEKPEYLSQLLNEQITCRLSNFPPCCSHTCVPSVFWTNKSIWGHKVLYVLHGFLAWTCKCL